MPLRHVELLTESFRSPPGTDVGVAHAVLAEVADGVRPETLRVHRPADIVAFGRRDTTAAGYPEAVAAARAFGFIPVERLAGGRAAVFHGGTIAFSWAIPTPEPRRDVHARFRLIADVLTAALRRLGFDARIGEVPGEYCPGAYSINLGGRLKVVGVGQRLVRGAAHLGGVVVVEGRERIRDVLVPVYRALAVDWDPATTGDLAMAVPGVDLAAVEEAIIAEFGRRFDLAPGHLSPETVARGRRLAASHLPQADTRTNSKVS